MSTVGVIFGGPSPEHDVSVLTGLQAARALKNTGSAVTLLYWTRSAKWYELPPDQEASSFVQGIPPGGTELSLLAMPGGGFVAKGGRFGRDRKLGIEVALVCCHGGPGEDGTLQAALDLAEIPYSGPTAASAALGMDKLAFGALAAALGLPTLDRTLLGSQPIAFRGPYIVKPRFGGSSIGIEVVEDLETAQALLKSSRHLRRGAVVEPWRDDLVDLNVAVRTWPSLEISAIEKPLKLNSASSILSYADKYVGGEGMVSAPRELPAVLSPKMEQSVRDMASELVYAAGVRGVARIDFLYGDPDQIYVNELNTVPGSLAKYLWVQPPLEFPRLLADLLAEARAVQSAVYSTEGADGSALRSAGTIASKLA